MLSSFAAAQGFQLLGSVSEMRGLVLCKGALGGDTPQRRFCCAASLFLRLSETNRFVVLVLAVVYLKW